MKKTISLLLALVLCLSLCACGSNKAENPTTIPTEVIESTASKYADHPLLSQLYGTWEFERVLVLLGNIHYSNHLR